MSYSKIALLVAIVCLLFCILYESVFLQYEAANNFIYSLGVVFNCISLSVIASCIFYFITDYFPKRHRQQEINNYIVRYLHMLSEIGNTVMMDIVGKNNASKSEFRLLCNKDLMEQNPITNLSKEQFKSIDNWLDYFKCLRRVEGEIIDKLMKVESNLSIEVKLTLLDINSDNTFKTLLKEAYESYNTDISKRNMRIYAEEIYEHITTLSNIVSLHERTSRL